jgi:hypothetical protein
MTNRTPSVIGWCVVLVGFSLTSAALAQNRRGVAPPPDAQRYIAERPASRATATEIDPHKTMYLTFYVPVRLPGVTLKPGPYLIERAAPSIADDVVRVMSRDRLIPYYMGFTHAVERPPTVTSDRPLALGEATRESPAPITAWFPEDEPVGYQFVYTGR